MLNYALYAVFGLDKYFFYLDKDKDNATRMYLDKDKDNLTHIYLDKDKDEYIFI